MEELRILPIQRIHDTDFYVDLEKLEFRQVDNDKNAISFYDVTDNGDQTEIIYDPKTKNAFKGRWDEMSQPKDLVLVKLPRAIELDTEYVADQLVENLREKYHGGIRRTDDEGTLKWSGKHPPIVRIYDTDFYLDLDKQQFRQVSNETNSFPFSAMTEKGDTDLIYDPKTKNLYKGTLEEMGERNDLILVKFPDAVRHDINQKTGQFNEKFKDEAFFKERERKPNEQRRKPGRGI